MEPNNFIEEFFKTYEIEYSPEDVAAISDKYKGRNSDLITDMFNTYDVELGEGDKEALMTKYFPAKPTEGNLPKINLGTPMIEESPVSLIDKYKEVPVEEMLTKINKGWAERETSSEKINKNYQPDIPVESGTPFGTEEMPTQYAEKKKAADYEQHEKRVMEKFPELSRPDIPVSGGNTPETAARAQEDLAMEDTLAQERAIVTNYVRDLSPKRRDYELNKDLTSKDRATFVAKAYEHELQKIQEDTEILSARFDLDKKNGLAAFRDAKGRTDEAFKAFEDFKAQLGPENLAFVEETLGTKSSEEIQAILEKQPDLAPIFEEYANKANAAGQAYEGFKGTIENSQLPEIEKLSNRYDETLKSAKEFYVRYPEAFKEHMEKTKIMDSYIIRDGDSAFDKVLKQVGATKEAVVGAGTDTLLSAITLGVDFLDTATRASGYDPYDGYAWYQQFGDWAKRDAERTDYRLQDPIFSKDMGGNWQVNEQAIIPGIAGAVAQMGILFALTRGLGGGAGATATADMLALSGAGTIQSYGLYKEQLLNDFNVEDPMVATAGALGIAMAIGLAENIAPNQAIRGIFTKGFLKDYVKTLSKTSPEELLKVSRKLAFEHIGREVKNENIQEISQGYLEKAGNALINSAVGRDAAETVMSDTELAETVVLTTGATLLFAGANRNSAIRGERFEALGRLLEMENPIEKMDQLVKAGAITEAQAANAAILIREHEIKDGNIFNKKTGKQLTKDSDFKGLPDKVIKEEKRKSPYAPKDDTDAQQTEPSQPAETQTQESPTEATPTTEAPQPAQAETGTAAVEEQPGQRTDVKVGDKFNYNFGLARDGVVEVIEDLGNGNVRTRYQDGTVKVESKANLIAYLNNPTYEVYTEINENTETGDITTNSPELAGLSLQEQSKAVADSIESKDLFSDGGTFANQLGGSGIDSVPTARRVRDGIEFVEFSNPNTGDVDVIMTGTSDSDYVGYYRIYEDGKPTNKWSSKLENQSRNKKNFKIMMSGVQEMLPEGHQYTETTSISTDGLRVWAQQLKKGYDLIRDKAGNLVTNRVAINGDALKNVLGISVNAGNFENIQVTNKKDFETVKQALLPFLEKFGLDESNIHHSNGTVEIDLPVLQSNPATEPEAESTTGKAPTVDDGAFTIEGDGGIYRINRITGKTQEFINGDWQNTGLSKKQVLNSASKQGFKKVADPLETSTEQTQETAETAETPQETRVEYNGREYVKDGDRWYKIGKDGERAKKASSASWAQERLEPLVQKTEPSTENEQAQPVNEPTAQEPTTEAETEVTSILDDILGETQEEPVTQAEAAAATPASAAAPATTPSERATASASRQPKPTPKPKGATEVKRGTFQNGTSYTRTSKNGRQFKYEAVNDDGRFVFMRDEKGMVTPFDRRNPMQRAALEEMAGLRPEGYADGLMERTFQTGQESEFKPTTDNADRAGAQLAAIRWGRRLSKALAKIAPNLKVYYYTNNEDYVNSSGTEKARGTNAYNLGDTIHINLASPTLQTNSAPHEAIHVILNAIKEANLALYNEIITDLHNRISGKKALSKYKEYGDTAIGDIKEEAVVEFLTDVANGAIELSAAQNRVLLQVVKNWINTLLEKVGIKAKIPVDMDNLYPLLETITQGLRQDFEIDLEVAGVEGGTTGNTHKFQFIGQNAELSQNVRNNLELARKLEQEGKSTKQIRLETGWERGADGKWRYEVPDEFGPLFELEAFSEKLFYDAEEIASLETSLINLRMASVLTDKEATEIKDKRQELVSKVKLGKLSETAAKKDFEDFISVFNIKQRESDKRKQISEIERKIDELEASEYNHNGRYKETFILKDILPAIGKLYKGLKELPITISRIQGHKRVSGAFLTLSGMPSSIIIDVPFKNVNIEEVKSAIVHEVQHAIQLVEAFAKGGTVMSVLDEIKRNKAATIIAEKTESLKKELEKNRAKFREDSVKKSEEISQEAEELLKQANAALFEREDEKEYHKLKEKAFEKRREAVRVYTQQSNEELDSTAKAIRDIENEVFDMIEQEFKDYGYSNSFDLYMALSGEVEARNVQSRMNMTPKQRAATTIQETEDVAREEQILLFQTGKLFSTPNPEAIDLHEKYIETRGLGNLPTSPITALDVDRAKNIADAFEAAEHRPNDPEVKAAYEAMVAETVEQFEFIKDAGYDVELEFGKGEPYNGSADMVQSVADTKVMKVLPTEQDFGQEGITEKMRQENPLLRDSGYKDKNGQPLLNNDVFRFVHDFFGHSVLGNSFGPKGEENAWNTHARMYSPAALPAVTTETRGQNSWVNFGPHMRNEDGSIKKKGDPGYLSPQERPFAQQKITLLPEFAADFTVYNTQGVDPEMHDITLKEGDIGSDIKFQTGTNFRSNAQTGLAQITQNAATPEQWIKMISDKGGKGTSQELEWMGLKGNLEAYIEVTGEKSVPKEMVEKFIKDAAIEIREISSQASRKELDRVLEAENNLHRLATTQATTDEEWADLDDQYSYWSRELELAKKALAGSGTLYSKYKLEGGNNYREILFTFPSSQGLYTSEHWAVKDVLAHIRLTDRVTNDRSAPKEKVLFVEEVQSDWAQDGKKKGFKVDQIKDADGPVPNMPYKKTDQWAGMAMRRILQMAAQEGYDRVAWVTGEQSAARYQLDQAVSFLTVNTLESTGEKSVEIALKDNSTVEFYVDKEGVVTRVEEGEKGLVGKSLDNIVGKEMAARILGVEGRKELSGDGLRVGADGMKTFYNNILPKIAKAEAKRFDKAAKMEVYDFRGKTERETAEALGDEAAAPSLDKPTQQLSIPITEKMREVFSEPIPLFQTGQDPLDRVLNDPRIQAALKGPNRAQVVQQIANRTGNTVKEVEARIGKMNQKTSSNKSSASSSKNITNTSIRATISNWLSQAVKDYAAKIGEYTPAAIPLVNQAADSLIEDAIDKADSIEDAMEMIEKAVFDVRGQRFETREDANEARIMEMIHMVAMTKLVTRLGAMEENALAERALFITQTLASAAGSVLRANVGDVSPESLAVMTRITMTADRNTAANKVQPNGKSANQEVAELKKALALSEKEKADLKERLKQALAKGTTPGKATSTIKGSGRTKVQNAIEALKKQFGIKFQTGNSNITNNAFSQLLDGLVEAHLGNMRKAKLEFIATIEDLKSKGANITENSVDIYNRLITKKIVDKANNIKKTKLSTYSASVFKQFESEAVKAIKEAVKTDTPLSEVVKQLVDKYDLDNTAELKAAVEVIADAIKNKTYSKSLNQAILDEAMKAFTEGSTIGLKEILQNKLGLSKSEAAAIEQELSEVWAEMFEKEKRKKLEQVLNQTNASLEQRIENIKARIAELQSQKRTPAVELDLLEQRKRLKEALRHQKHSTKVPKSKMDKLMEAAKLGALNDEAYFNAFSEKFGLPYITEEQASTLSNAIENYRNARTTAQKEKALMYVTRAIDDIADTRTAVRVMRFMQAQFTVGILSRPSSQATAAFGSFIAMSTSLYGTVVGNLGSGLGRIFLGRLFSQSLTSDIYSNKFLGGIRNLFAFPTRAALAQVTTGRDSVKYTEQQRFAYRPFDDLFLRFEDNVKYFLENKKFNPESSIPKQILDGFYAIAMGMGTVMVRMLGAYDALLRAYSYDTVALKEAYKQAELDAPGAGADWKLSIAVTEKLAEHRLEEIKEQVEDEIEEMEATEGPMSERQKRNYRVMRRKELKLEAMDPNTRAATDAAISDALLMGDPKGYLGQLIGRFLSARQITPKDSTAVAALKLTTTFMAPILRIAYNFAYKTIHYTPIAGQLQRFLEDKRTGVKTSAVDKNAQLAVQLTNTFIFLAAFLSSVDIEWDDEEEELGLILKAKHGKDWFFRITGEGKEFYDQTDVPDDYVPTSIQIRFGDCDNCFITIPYQDYPGGTMLFALGGLHDSAYFMPENEQGLKIDAVTFGAALGVGTARFSSTQSFSQIFRDVFDMVSPVTAKYDPASQELTDVTERASRMASKKLEKILSTGILPNVGLFKDIPLMSADYKDEALRRRPYEEGWQKTLYNAAMDHMLLQHVVSTEEGYEVDPIGNPIQKDLALRYVSGLTAEFDTRRPIMKLIKDRGDIQVPAHYRPGDSLALPINGREQTVELSKMEQKDLSTIVAVEYGYLLDQWVLKGKPGKAKNVVELNEMITAIHGKAIEKGKKYFADYVLPKRRAGK